MRKPSAPLLAAVGFAVVVAAAGTRARATRRRLRALPPGARQLRHLHRRPRPDLAPVGLGLQALRRLRAESAAPQHLPGDRRVLRRRWRRSAGLTPVMGWQAVMHFGFHLGLTDWLEFVVDIPVSAEGYTAAYGDNGSFGSTNIAIARTGFYANSGYTNVPPPNAAPLDWRLGFKARLFRAGIFGLAAAAVVTLPFGDDVGLPRRQRLHLPPDLDRRRHARPDHRRRQRRRHHPPRDHRARAERSAPTGSMTALPRTLIDVGHELTWSAGVSLPLRPLGRHRRRSLRPRAARQLRATKSRSTPARTSPPTSIGGFQFFPIKDIAIGVGAGAGLLGSPMRHDDFRVFGGITWAPGRRQGRRRRRRHRHRRRRHPRRAGSVPDRARGQGRLRRRGRLPRSGQRSGRHPRQARQVPERAGGQGRLPGRRRLPRARQRRRRHPRRAGQVPERSGRQGRLPGRRRLPRSRQRRRRHPRRARQVPERAGDAQRRRRRRRLPGLGRSGRPSPAARSSCRRTSTSRPARTASPAARRRCWTASPRRSSRTRGVKRIRIEGHTDDVGGAKKNQELSQARAESVRNFLIKKGVEPERLQAVGYGDTRPLDKRKTADARAKNRRVEFIIVEQ